MDCGFLIYRVCEDSDMKTDESKTQEQRKRIAAKQIIAEIEIGNIQKILANNGIDVVVLKGPHLSNTVYQRESNRDYCDLDLLVHPKSFEQALRLLEENDYKRIELSRDRKATQINFYNYHFRTPGGMSLELHRYFSQLDRYPLDYSRLITEAREFLIGQVRAKGLKPEHLLVHLIIHILKSYFNVKRKHFEDIALVCRNWEIDWKEVEGLLDFSGAKFGAYFVFKAVDRFHGFRPPEEIMCSLRPGLIRRIWLNHFIETELSFVEAEIGRPFGLSQRRLALPLMDSKRKWIEMSGRYLWLRIKDLIMSYTPL